MVLLARAPTGLSSAAVQTWRLPRRLRLAEQARHRRRVLLKPRAPTGPGEPPRLLARLLFSMTAEDEAAMRRLLLEQARRDYGAAIAAEARRLGYDIANVRVTDPTLLKELNERARFAAHSIRGTYNKDLEREIARIRREAPRANRHVYAHRLSRWDKRRADWKNHQIGVTEMGQTVNKARADFYDRNGIAAVARVVPRTAVCMTCAGYIGMGDMTVAEGRSLELPVHVNCDHEIEYDYSAVTSPLELPGALPAQEVLWTGGEIVEV